MKGKNTITKPFPNEDGSLKVHSVWYTIQGEGPDSGRPAVFVRLSHCNLRCFYCDTQFDTGLVLSLDDAVDKVYTLSKQHKCNFAVITGGEPFLQNVVPFVKALNRLEISVSVETAGTTYVPGLHQVFHPRREIYDNAIVCSPKTPRLSGSLVPLIHALKYIVKIGDVSVYDGLPINSTQVLDKQTKLYRPCSALCTGTPVYIQPMDEDDPTSTRANMELAAAICMKYGYRLSIQTHKLVGVD